MKKLIKKLLRESLLNEKRFEESDLPNTTVLIENGNKLTLYDTKFLKNEEPDLGVLAFIGLHHSRNLSSVEIVAAKKGYGPLIYELAMEFVSPNYLVSTRDGDTRSGAVRIWEYFIDGNNPNVEVKTIKPYEEGYVDCLDFGCDDEMPDFFKVYNSRFLTNDSNMYYMLESNGSELLENIGDEYRDIITDWGQNFFDSVY